MDNGDAGETVSGISHPVPPLCQTIAARIRRGHIMESLTSESLPMIRRTASLRDRRVGHVLNFHIANGAGSGPEQPAEQDECDTAGQYRGGNIPPHVSCR